MRWTSTFDKFDRLVTRITKSLNYVGLGILMLCMFLTTGDVIGRYMRHPIPGTLELTEISLAMVVFLGLAWTMAIRGHVSISLFTSRMSQKAQAITDAINSFFMLGLWGLIVWQSYLMAMRTRGDITDYLKIPLLPFKLLVTLGASFMCLVLITIMVNSIRKAKAA